MQYQQIPFTMPVQIKLVQIAPWLDIWSLHIYGSDLGQRHCHLLFFVTPCGWQSALPHLKLMVWELWTPLIQCGAKAGLIYKESCLNLANLLGTEADEVCSDDMVFHVSCGDTDLQEEDRSARLEMWNGCFCREWLQGVLCWATSVSVDRAFPVLVQLLTPIDLSSTIFL